MDTHASRANTLRSKVTQKFKDIVEPPDEGVYIYCRRMVTILAHVQPLKDEPIQAIASGFVISLNGKQWLVTAGHVAHALQEVQKAGRRLQVMICDAWKAENGLGVPIQLPLDRIPNWIILGDETSYDVAILDLGANLSALLQKGLIKPVPETAWRQKPNKNFDAYILLGTPNEMTDNNGESHKFVGGAKVVLPPTKYNLRRGAFSIKEISRPAQAVKTSHPRFYAKLLDMEDAVRFVELPEGPLVDEIKGVSGGPILGRIQEDDGKYSYHTIAVQSCWLKEEKAITADYLYLLPQKLKAAGHQVSESRAQKFGRKIHNIRDSSAA